MLEQGPHEVMIAQQSVRMGQPLPARIANAPELMLGLQVYLQAFFDLDSERSHANGCHSFRGLVSTAMHGR